MDFVVPNQVPNGRIRNQHFGFIFQSFNLIDELTVAENIETAAIARGGSRHQARQRIARLIEEFDLTHAEAATAVGRSRAAVSNLLRLQELADRVKPLVEDRSLDMGHARALLAIQDPIQQFDAARQVAKKGLSVRATEQLVKHMLSGKPRPKTPPTREANADIRRLEMDISDRLGARVRIDHGKKGGKLVITYNSLDELDGILGHIK